MTAPTESVSQSFATIPQPAYLIDGNTLGFSGPMFQAAADAAGYIDGVHRTWVWSIDGITLTCPANVPSFTNADFVGTQPPSTTSASTPWKPIRRQWGTCASAIGSKCLSMACVDDPTLFQYSMKARCPAGLVFDSTHGKARCECPTGQELARNADGTWACSAICSPGVDQPSCYRNDLSCSAGNPVQLGIAAKVQTEVDYEGSGAHPLRFSRSFRSNGARPWVAPGGWSHWVHNWGRRIDTYSQAGWRSSRAYVIREDARQIVYATDGGGTWAPVQSGDRNELKESRDSSGLRTGFTYRIWSDDSVEHYNALGQLTRVVQRNGWTHTLTYSGDRLVSVKNHFGRELRLNYGPDGRLLELLPPGSSSGTPPGSPTSPIRYSHEESGSLGSGVAQAGQLTSVTWQDGRQRRYHYESPQFPGWLTGITDEAGTRIGTYVYDTYGRIRREFGPGGINELQFRYLNGAEVIDYSTGTTTSTLYTFETAPGVVRPVTVSKPCPLCGSSQARTAYTAAGDVARSVGHDGRITFYSYDTKGRETERAMYGAGYASATTRPALNLAEQVVSTRWHTTWNLPTTVAEPGKTSSYSYSSLGQVTSQSWSATTDATGAAKFSASKTGSTYATAWTYDASRLNTVIVERTDAVETQRWTLAYNGMGDLIRITDVTGAQSATLSNDPHGRPTGLAASSGATASLSWNTDAQLSAATLPGYGATFSYDALKRLREVTLSTGEWLRVTYNSKGEPTEVLNSSGQVQKVSGLSTHWLKSGQAWSAMQTMLASTLAQGARRLGDALVGPAVAQVPLMPVVPMPLGVVRGWSAAGGAVASTDADPNKPAARTCCAGVPSDREIQERFQRTLPFALLQGYVGLLDLLTQDILTMKGRSDLRKRMQCPTEVYYQPLPPGCWEAHHIVAFAHPLADESRTILRNVGIDINSPANGVWMACDKHRGMHTDAYYTKVEDRLTNTSQDRLSIERALAIIRAQLQSGTF